MLSGRKKNAKSFNKLKAGLVFNLQQVFLKSPAEGTLLKETWSLQTKVISERFHLQSWEGV